MAADDQDDTGTDDTGAPEDQTASTDDWNAPDKDTWDKVQKALAKANAEAKRYREQHKAAQQQSEDDTAKAIREQTEAIERRYKTSTVRASARAAFLEAGLQGGTPERVTKLVRMLDLDALEVDDDGEVTGLADQVTAIKADYPELFKPQEKRPPRITPGDRAGTNGRTMSASERQAAAVLGR